LARRADGIHLAPFEQGEIGPDLFRAACDMMLEGLVSKRRDSRYRPGPSRDWIKVKNPKSPAMNREGCVRLTNAKAATGLRIGGGFVRITSGRGTAADY
jgi:hypothetical protein